MVQLRGAPLAPDLTGPHFTAVTALGGTQPSRELLRLRLTRQEQQFPLTYIDLPFRYEAQCGAPAGHGVGPIATERGPNRAASVWCANYDACQHLQRHSK